MWWSVSVKGKSWLRLTTPRTCSCLQRICAADSTIPCTMKDPADWVADFGTDNLCTCTAGNTCVEGGNTCRKVCKAGEKCGTCGCIDPYECRGPVGGTQTCQLVSVQTVVCSGVRACLAQAVLRTVVQSVPVRKENCARQDHWFTSRATVVCLSCPPPPSAHASPLQPKCSQGDVCGVGATCSCEAPHKCFNGKCAVWTRAFGGPSWAARSRYPICTEAINTARTA